MINTIDYFRWLRLKYLLRDATLSEACQAMFVLNHYAGTLSRYSPETIPGLRKQAIYNLKDLLIQQLYAHGDAVHVQQDLQHFACWACDGTGEYYTGAECYKCDGTGVYRSTLLYKFVFQVEGQTYVWHVPASLVKYPVQVSESSIGEYRHERTNDGQWNIPQLRHLFATALVYLENTDLRDHIQFEFTLREALSLDWTNSRLVYFLDDLRYPLRRWGKWLAQQHGRLVCALRGCHVFASCESTYCRRCERWIEPELDPLESDRDGADDCVDLHEDEISL